MLLEKKKDIKSRLKEDEKLMTREPRYGYFSIPYNATIGDGFYSQEANYHHKVVDRKVIGERRGIYTRPGKSGKGKDAYLKCMDYTEDKDIDIMKETVQKEKSAYLQRIQERKEQKPSIPFKLCGTHSNKTKDNVYLTNSSNKTRKDKTKPSIPHFNADQLEANSRAIESVQKGFYNTTGILFKLPNLPINIDVWHTKSIQKHLKSSKPFVPVSMNTNGCFASDKVTYGSFDESIKTLSNPSLEYTRAKAEWLRTKQAQNIKQKEIQSHLQATQALRASTAKRVKAIKAKEKLKRAS